MCVCIYIYILCISGEPRPYPQTPWALCVSVHGRPPPGVAPNLNPNHLPQPGLVVSTFHRHPR